MASRHGRSLFMLFEDAVTELFLLFFENTSSNFLLLESGDFLLGEGD